MSVGNGEKSPSKSSPCASVGSTPPDSAGLADASVLLTCCLRILPSDSGESSCCDGKRGTLSSLRVIPRSALHLKPTTRGLGGSNTARPSPAGRDQVLIHSCQHSCQSSVRGNRRPQASGSAECCFRLGLWLLAGHEVIRVNLIK